VVDFLSVKGKEMLNNAPILCVDNDPESAKLLLVWLQTSGCEAISASSCEEAIKLFETHKFELCIVDYRMPDATGVELCQQVRQKYPTLPFILNTGDVRPQVQTEAQQAGMHFFPKPTDLDALLQVVQSIVDC
jgi:CheY-like chemotaxis protein